MKWGDDSEEQTRRARSSRRSLARLLCVQGASGVAELYPARLAHSLEWGQQRHRVISSTAPALLSSFPSRGSPGSATAQACRAVCSAASANHAVHSEQGRPAFASSMLGPAVGSTEELSPGAPRSPLLRPRPARPPAAQQPCPRTPPAPPRLPRPRSSTRSPSPSPSRPSSTRSASCATSRRCAASARAFTVTADSESHPYLAVLVVRRRAAARGGGAEVGGGARAQGVPY